jgi:hypothetical protein
VFAGNGFISAGVDDGQIIVWMNAKVEREEDGEEEGEAEGVDETGLRERGNEDHCSQASKSKDGGR